MRRRSKPSQMEQHAPPQDVRRTLRRHRRQPGTGAAQQRKTLALLALLAAGGRRGLSRDKLIASLWPETDAEHGRGLLKQACYALRRDLQAPELFLGSIQLSLNPAVISSDLEAFACSAGGERSSPGGLLLHRTISGRLLPQWGWGVRDLGGDRARPAGEPMPGCVGGAVSRGDRHGASTGWRRTGGGACSSSTR